MEEIKNLSKTKQIIKCSEIMIQSQLQVLKQNNASSRAFEKQEKINQQVENYISNLGDIDNISDDEYIACLMKLCALFKNAHISLKNKDEETKKIVDFIKSADIYLDDYRYDEKMQLKIDNKEAEEKILKNQDIVDQMRMVSVYKGRPVPSIIFDSLGTRKIAALASYVITSIEKGKTLIIDELDSSLHFKITRAIISMFNNELNKNAQLIATLHDISLLDCKKMFRKEQIWFTDKNEEQTELYSLKHFSYEQTGIRGDTTDIQDRYSKGAFGAIPDPDLISTLLEVDVDAETD